MSDPVTTPDAAPEGGSNSGDTGAAAPAAEPEQQGSVLSSGAGESSAAPSDAGTDDSGAGDGGAGVGSFSELLPEQFRVMGEGDLLDVEQSAGKLLDQYNQITDKVGGLPPESADKYEIDFSGLGDEFDSEGFMSDEKNKAFLEKAHEHGMTSKQVQFAVEYALNEMIPELIESEVTEKADACMAALSEKWPDESVRKSELGNAYRMLNSLPAELKGSIDSKFGNDPDFVQMAALLGKEMAEDSSPSDTALNIQNSIDGLLASEAYNDQNHPEHEATAKKINAYYTRKFGNKLAQ